MRLAAVDEIDLAAVCSECAEIGPVAKQRECATAAIKIAACSNDHICSVVYRATRDCERTADLKASAGQIDYAAIERENGGRRHIQLRKRQTWKGDANNKQCFRERAHASHTLISPCSRRVSEK